MKIKRQETTQLPRFVVGALAAAGASGANGATVQITFANNVVSTVTGTTNFNGDLTGGGVAQIWADGTYVGAGFAEVFAFPNTLLAQGRYVFASSGGTPLAFVAGAGVSVGVNPVVRGLVGVVFQDTRINGGTETNGWLDLEAASRSLAGGSVQIHRLIFDDASTSAPTDVAFTDGAYAAWQVSAVPEPSSNLALLALGAGGLLTRRRLRHGVRSNS